MAYNKETGMYEGFIYKITNTVNGKVYIGQTITTINDRFSKHIYEAFRRQDKSMIIYKAIRKYGADSFSICEIEKIENNDKRQLVNLLNISEIKWISKYNSTDINYGYNISLGGNNNSDRFSKKVKQYHISGELIKIWDSISDAARYYNVSKQSITCVCTNKSNICCGYIWRYEKDEFETYNVKLRKKICQYSLDGKFINIYYSEDFPKEFNIHIAQSVCRGKVKTHRGYVWRYEGDPFELYDSKPAQRKNIKSINCYNINNDFIKHYNSISDVMLEIKLKSTSTVYSAIKNHNLTAAGYKWYYADDVTQPDKTKIFNK